MSDHVLSIDIGTTNLAVLILSLSSGEISTSSHRLVSSFPAPGHIEQDAQAIWDATQAAIEELFSKTGLTANDIRAIGVTSQRASIVIWDSKTGDVLAPMILWNDLRGVDRSTELKDMGFVAFPQQSATKLEQALASLEPPIASSTIWGGIDSFIVWKLSGRNVTDRSQAWASGYLDYSGTGWNEALIEAQRIPSEMFPELVDTRGPIVETDIQAFGARVPISAIVADQQCALIAHGNLKAGARKMTYGTAGVFNLTTGASPSFVGGTIAPFIQSHVDGDTVYCIEGMILSAGAMFDWLVEGLALAPSVGDLSSIAETVDDSNGVYVLPALWGLGAPHGKSEARGRIVGLSADVNQAHLIRASLESVAYRVREIVDAVNEADIVPPLSTPELPVDGGATRIPALLQIQADILQQPVKRMAVSDSTAFGAALSAAIGIEAISETELASYVKYDHVFEPAISQDAADTQFAQWKSQVYSD